MYYIENVFIYKKAMEVLFSSTMLKYFATAPIVIHIYLQIQTDLD